ncbi:hypothetical protein HON71_01690 [Candidatus Woesearchaeota archaeon]|jgi:hypothetical protein|nr:hypothetical protein [Candidatus Woesearchaeota archaeon]
MGITDAVSGAATGGQAGPATAGAYVAGKEIVGAAKNISWILLVLGVFHYIIRITSGASAITLVFSLTLCFLGVYALSAKLDKDRKGRMAILIPVTVFFVWYFVFGANHNPQFLIIFLSIFFGISMIFGLFSKGSSFEPEMYGFLPALFFFLDVGLIPFLIRDLNLPITPLMQNLVLFMPWWAFFGLLTLPSEASDNKKVNFLVTIFKVVGILYLVLVIVAPSLPNVGYDDSLLPSVGELEEAQANFRAQSPDLENPGWSNLKCIMAGRFTDLPVCIQERQENSQLEAACKQKGYKKGTLAFVDCTKEQKEEEAKLAYSAGGFYTPTVKDPMKAEIKINKEQLISEYDPEWGYSAEINIINPSKQTFKAAVLCDFTDKKNKKVIDGNFDSSSEFEISEENYGETFICTPAEELDGSYTLNMTLRLSGLTTESYLVRAFMGTEKEIEEMTNQQVRETKDEILKEIKSANIAAQSFSAKDFARINYYFGHTKSNVVIEDKKPLPVLVLTLENLGSGQVTKLENYELIFPPGNFDFSDPSCKADNIQNLNVKKKKFTFKQCRLEDFPYSDLQLGDWRRETMTAVLKYDYQIFKKVQISPNQEKISLIK